MTILTPEPFGWLLDCLPNGSLAFQRERPSEMQSLVNSTVTVITTTQAEAYAATKVRKALEEAAQACEARIGQHASGITPEDVEDCDEEARECAAAIRTVIPK